MYVVRKGDRFADRFRAVSVSEDAVEAVEAVEEPPALATAPPSASPSFPGLLSASVEQGLSPFPSENFRRFGSDGLSETPAGAPTSPSADMSSLVPRIRSHGQAGRAARTGTGILPQASPHQDGHALDAPVRPAKHAQEVRRINAQDTPATFVFQTLGYVETQDGEFQAIVADGADVYLVKQGETFADQYRATSVDPVLVLAVKVLPGQHAGNFLSAQTDSGSTAASKNLGALQFPLFGGPKHQLFARWVRRAVRF